MIIILKKEKFIVETSTFKVCISNKFVPYPINFNKIMQ